MRISDLVAEYISNLLDSDNGTAEIQRNELAGEIGCVPSQINYVITSRFSPEHGYIVESRRGGGGYIRITRVGGTEKETVLHIVNSIGDNIDNTSAEILLTNMLRRKMLSLEEYNMMSAAVSERSYCAVPKEYRETLRAGILKNMLIMLLNK